MNAPSVPTSAIAGRNVLVTGANRGLGRALVEEALRLGASRVYAGTRRPLPYADPRVHDVNLDLADPDAAQRVAGELDGLDVLINNAGIYLPAALGDDRVLEQHLAVNLYGPRRLTEALLPALRASRGRVVNVLSLAALSPIPGVPAYSISKAATHSWTQALRMQEAEYGVRVHAVLAGPIDTEMVRDLDLPKASPASVATAILAGVEADVADIFPDPMSAKLEASWLTGTAKRIEQLNAALLTPAASA